MYEEDQVDIDMPGMQLLYPVQLLHAGHSGG